MRRAKLCYESCTRGVGGGFPAKVDVTTGLGSELSHLRTVALNTASLAQLSVSTSSSKLAYLNGISEDQRHFWIANDERRF